MSKILVQLSGSIAAYKACILISRLVQAGHEVKTVATKGALQFIGKATLEGLSSHPVFCDIYEEGRMMDHIHLAKWADLSILAPASANTLNRLSQGLADDVVGTLFLAWNLKTKPYLVAPAMNQQMIDHPATKNALIQIENWGVRVLPSGDGHQACGDTGLGRLLEPEQILEIVYQELNKKIQSGPVGPKGHNGDSK